MRSPHFLLGSHDLVTKAYTDIEFKYVGNRPADSWEDGLKELANSGFKIRSQAFFISA